MSTLQLYEFSDFQGNCKTITEDTPDLSAVGFFKRAQSLKVHGEPWIVYSDIKYGHGYQGDFKCFKKGDYSSLSPWDNKISSVRVVKGGLGNPKITLYDYANYEGKSVTIPGPESSLKKHEFDKRASSHQVAAGAWILYTDYEFKGDKMITLAGDKVPDYRDIGWDKKVSSLEPLNE